MFDIDAQLARQQQQRAAELQATVDVVNIVARELAVRLILAGGSVEDFESVIDSSVVDQWKALAEQRMVEE